MASKIARLARLEPALLHLFAATSEKRSDCCSDPSYRRGPLQKRRFGISFHVETK
jgi:hypothetical protein